MRRAPLAGAAGNRPVRPGADRLAPAGRGPDAGAHGADAAVRHSGGRAGRPLRPPPAAGAQPRGAGARLGDPLDPGADRPDPDLAGGARRLPQRHVLVDRVPGPADHARRIGGPGGAQSRHGPGIRDQQRDPDGRPRAGRRPAASARTLRRLSPGRDPLHRGDAPYPAHRLPSGPPGRRQPPRSWPCWSRAGGLRARSA